MKFSAVTESGQGVPVGIYQGAEFLGVEPVPANIEKGFKPGWKFNFKTAVGIASRILGGERPTTKNGLGKFLAEMTGIPVTPGVEYDVEPLIGKSFTIVVKQSDGGGTRVDTVMPVA